MDADYHILDRLLELDQQLTLALNGSDSLFLDGVAKVATATVTWIPVAIVLLYVIIRSNRLHDIILIILSIALCILISDQVASGICKPMFERFRPAQDPSLMYLVDIVDGYRGGRYGFFSSHAANTFSVAVFVSLLIRHRVLSLGLFSWALFNCWTRIYLGVHYCGDILIGIIWGSIVGWLVYSLFKRSINLDIKTKHHSEVQTVTGYSLCGAYQILSMLLLTYIVILILGTIYFM